MLLALSIFVIGAAVALYVQYFTPEERLRREMVAYVARQRLKPVPNLSTNHIPILLKWMRQPEPGPTMRDHLADFLRRVTWKKIDIPYSRGSSSGSPGRVASSGFRLLGTNAAFAVPALAEIARTPAFGNAMNALISIGAPSLAAAETFCRDPDPKIRESGASLVGEIGKNHDRSVAILLPLLDDPNGDVRSEAYDVIAQFPGPDTEEILIPRFLRDFRERSHNPTYEPTAAYSLHTGSTNALLHLIDACIQTANPNVRAHLLAALAARDAPNDLPHQEFSRHRRGKYWRYLQQFTESPPSPAFDHRLFFIRSNILETGLPQVEKALPPDNSSSGRLLQNPLQSRP